MTKVYVQDDLMDDQGRVSTHRFCCPIFITGMYGTLLSGNDALFGKDNKYPEVRSGTLTFVKYQGQIYGITCGHVVRQLEEKNNDRYREHIQAMSASCPFGPEAQMHFFFPTGNKQIHINSRFHKATGDEFTETGRDIAIARIRPEKLAQIGREPISACVGAPPKAARSSTFCGIATGYPEKARKGYQNNQNLSAMTVTTVAAIAPFAEISESQLVLYYELGENPDVDNLSGMSGGPVLWSDESGWGLAGIIRRGRDMIGNSDARQRTISTGPTIWIEGEPVTEQTLCELISLLPVKEEPIPDLTKAIYGLAISQKGLPSTRIR